MLLASLAVALFGVLVPSASAHFAGFTGGVEYWPYLYSGETYVYPTYHSYGFNSAHDETDDGYAELLCPIIYTGGMVPHYECGRGFERYCYQPWTHSSDDLDCHDEDGVAWKVGIWNRDADFAVLAHGHGVY